MLQNEAIQDISTPYNKHTLLMKVWALEKQKKGYP